MHVRTLLHMQHFGASNLKMLETTTTIVVNVCTMRCNDKQSGHITTNSSFPVQTYTGLSQLDMSGKEDAA